MPFGTNQAVTAEGKQTVNASTFKDFLDGIHILKHEQSSANHHHSYTILVKVLTIS